jgi:hypothetical protein
MTLPKRPWRGWWKNGRQTVAHWYKQADDGLAVCGKYASAIGPLVPRLALETNERKCLGCQAKLKQLTASGAAEDAPTFPPQKTL